MAQGEWKASFEEKCEFAHDYYIGLFNCLWASTLRSHGQDAVEQMNYQMIRRHQRDFFLPGLKKLGLDHEASDAIAAAKYHVLSNRMGGVDVLYAEESPEKAWIRYPSTMMGNLMGALSSRSIAVDFLGWHAHNGRSLGNPRMGYVVTHMVCQGDPYSAGYFKIYDHDLAHPEETFQFSQGERVPRIDPDAQPQLGPDWTPERKLRAKRNYSVEFDFEIIRTLLDMYGVGGARALVEQASAVNMVMQREKLIPALGLQEFDAAGIATFIQRERALLDEEVEIEKVSRDEYVVRQKTRNRRMFPDLSRIPVEVDHALLNAWRTFIELVNRDLTVDMTAALTAGDPHYEWVIHPRAD